MRIAFHGAAQTVTGSQHLIEINEKRILLDCGLYQGRRAEARTRNKTFPFDPRSIDVMVLSHAHIDHSGNIPNLVRQGFNGEIYCTYPTRDLCVNMLLDSAHIQEKDAEFYNRKLKKKGEAPIEALYTKEDALRSLDMFYTLPYRRQHQLMPGVSLRFLDAGHMLGSAIVELQMDDHESHREIRLVFSGDLGRKNLPIIRDPQTVAHADVLIMESTYGDRLHPPDESTEHELEAVVKRTVSRGGALIIPAFAVGRTQQLVYTLQKLSAEKRIPQVPIFVDSPLAMNVTEAFRNHPEVFDEEISTYMELYQDEDPFGFSHLRYTRNVEESKQLNTMNQPFVVISASGMAEHGRILHHLRNRVSDPKNTVLIVGWQAPHTLGRRLVEKVESVNIFGEPHPLRAEVAVMNGLSGHADRDELLAWVAAMEKKPQRSYLVHGEEAPAQALAKSLESQLELSHVKVPKLHEVVTI